MDSATQDLLYQKIYESFYDEEKIVTLPSVVRNLKVSIKSAKVLLKAFVNDSRNVKCKEEFYLTYLLLGNLKDDKGLAIYLVKEKDLNDMKSLFETIISEHIFSIQKSPCVNLNLIAVVDKIGLESNHEPYQGAVVSKSCVERNMKINKLSAQTMAVPNEVVTNKENGSFFLKNCNNGEIQKMDVQENHTQSSQEKLTKGKRSIANFFIKSVIKTPGNIKSKNENNGANENRNSIVTTQNQLTDNYNDTSNTDKENLRDEKMDVEIEFPISEKSQDQISNKKRKKGNKNNVPNKKRKRIQEICDSDSSDMFDDEKDEDIIEKSDEEPEHLTVIKSAPMPKNKRRKAVDKTYMDEEGFMVTTTEYTYESASEDEGKDVLKSCPEEQPKILLKKKNNTTDSENDLNNLKSKGRKNKKVASGKQTTLMNFFKNH